MLRSPFLAAFIGCPLLLAGCSSGAPASPVPVHEAGVTPLEVGPADATPPLAFPPGFQWSVSISAEESEGKNTTNDWYVFGQMGLVPPAGSAQDFYDLYETDFANAESLHLTSFQLTLEWGRIVPKMPADPTHLTP